MAIIDYNNGTATISINGGQPPFSYLLLQNDAAVNYPGVNFQNPVVSSNSSVVFGNSSDTSGTYGLPSGTYTCQVTDNLGCIINTSEIVIGQTMEATTTTILPTTTSTTLLQEYLTLTVDQSPVDEGLNILFTLTSSNIPNGTLIDWNITGGITSDDISGGLGGSFTIQNNQAQYLATIESDEILEGQETFTLALAAIDSNGVSGGLSVNVIINDMNTAATTTTTQATTSTTQATTSTTLATTSTTQATTSTTLATTSTTQATTSTTQATTTTAAPDPQHFNWVVSTDAAAINRINPVLEDHSTDPTCYTPNMQYWYYPLQAGETYYWRVEPTLTTSRIQLQMQSVNPGAYIYQILTDNFAGVMETPCNNLAGPGNGVAVTQMWLEDVGGAYGPAGNEVEGAAPYFVTEQNDTISNYYKFIVPANAEDTSEFACSGTSGSYSWNGSGYDTEFPFDNDEFSPIGFLVNFRILAPATTSTTLATTSTTLATTSTTQATTSTTLATTSTTLATTTKTPPTYYLFGAGQYGEFGIPNPQMFELAWANGTPGTTVGFTLSGTATEGVDYDYNLTEFSINSTSGQQDMSVTILQDNLTEGPETIILTLDALDSAGNSTGSPSVSVTINDTSIDPTTSTTLATTSTTLATTTTAAPEEETWYWFKGGGASNMPYTTSGPLTDANASYYIEGWATTSDLSVAMADLIENEGTTGLQGEVYMDINSFEFTGPITGTQCAHSWTYPEGTATFMYVAVPDTSVFTQDLTSAQEGLQYNCNGSVYYAADRKPFTYNGASYWLYLVSLEEPSASQTYGIVGDPANIS